MAEPDPGSMQVGPSAPQGMFCKANASVCSPQQHSKRRVQSSSKPGQPCSVLAGLNNAKYFICSSWLYSSVTRSLAAPAWSALIADQAAWSALIADQAAIW